MNTREINFLHQWINVNVPETAKADVASITETTHNLFTDAKAVGIKRAEIDEKLDSLYRALFA
ncbi:DUF768 domain-containing protein [Mesorhizobium sp. AR07]|uniref:DUF768 domain-containing protein n=1 Tax=Mesorhizobium sp. AR07 TaxID=2865838 RepID=UPI00215ECCD5|nr:hypothetical protein [Mesorhizobium sp. AR07]UVK43762.1 DUF768 domain-containing protein [Mesorhizobium sp. AR07]